jgi:hypothetical protein
VLQQQQQQLLQQQQQAALRRAAPTARLVRRSVGCPFVMKLTCHHSNPDKVHVSWSRHLRPATACVQQSLYLMELGKGPAAVAARLRKEVAYLLPPERYPDLPLQRTLIPLATLRAYKMRVARHMRMSSSDVEDVREVVQQLGASVMYYQEQECDAQGKITKHLELVICTPFMQVGGCLAAGWCARLVPWLDPACCKRVQHVQHDCSAASTASTWRSRLVSLPL